MKCYQKKESASHIYLCNNLAHPAHSELKIKIDFQKWKEGRKEKRQRKKEIRRKKIK